MAVKEQLSELFAALLETFQGGISNTSTSKYDPIISLVSKLTELPDSDIYATGTTSDRVSNLDTRYAQGNQRNQHTPLCLSFMNVKAHTGSGSRAERIEYFRTRAFNTSRKFVTGQERGTTFDAIVFLMQFDDGKDLTPVGALVNKDWPLKDKVLAALEVPAEGMESLERIVQPPAAQVLPFSPQPAPPEVARAAKAISSDLIRDLSAALTSAGVRHSKELLIRFVASLFSKRFMILQGLSGSGKTLLALAVAKWFRELEDQVRVVAVGADWSTNEHILGYLDALDPNSYRRPPSGALDVILAAKADPNRPYFLILDEMNLSHVERYFADLLSAMESGHPLALHARDEEVDGVPPQTAIPSNLLIIGTVNVDDTTHPFSPKVLDRANVIEFRVSGADLGAYLDSPTRVDLDSIERAGVEYAAGMADSVSAHVELRSLEPPVADGPAVSASLNEDLAVLHERLSPLGWEFGFRVAREVHRFVYWHAVLTPPPQEGERAWALVSALDAVIVQKLMPKLRGSERRLRPVLESLSSFAAERGLPLTGAKVARMLDRARDGYTAFSEA